LEKTTYSDTKTNTEGAEGVEIALGLAIVAVALAVAFGRSMRRRSQLADSIEDKPKRMSKRDKKLAEIRANDPVVEIPSLNDLIEEELAETGVNDIEGHEGLNDAVKLKVYHRDIGSLDGCERSNLRYRLSYGIEAETASVEDVRLTCGDDDDEAPHQTEEQASPPGEAEAGTADVEATNETDHT